MSMDWDVEDKDLGWEDILKAVEEMEDSEVVVGWNDEDHNGSDLTLAEMAAMLEFGSEDGHIPASAPLATAFDSNRADIAALVNDATGRVIDGKIEAKTALGRVANGHAGHVQEDLENAESTILQDGSGTPLIDTGALEQGIIALVRPR